MQSRNYKESFEDLRNKLKEMFSKITGCKNPSGFLLKKKSDGFFIFKVYDVSIKSKFCHSLMFPLDLVQIRNLDWIDCIKWLFFIDLLFACVLFQKCTTPVIKPERKDQKFIEFSTLSFVVFV